MCRHQTFEGLELAKLVMNYLDVELDDRYAIDQIRPEGFSGLFGVALHRKRMACFMLDHSVMDFLQLLDMCYSLEVLSSGE